MKNRIFMDMYDGVYRVVINTQDWSEGDLLLMDQFGEPEVNVGGDIRYISVDDGSDSSGSSGSGSVKTKTLGDMYVRLVHGFPFSMGFDSRDYGSVADAVSAGNAWKDLVLGRIRHAVEALRALSAPLPTEEVSEL